MQIVGWTKSTPRLVLLVCLGLFSSTNAQESPFIYGIHDHDTNIQEYLDHFSAGGVTGWVTATIAIGSNPSDTGGDDFRWIANQGHTVIVRLNNGYCGTGNIPTPDKYDDFAQRAANYVAATQGADIFIVGNETNLAVEWPPVNGHAQYVSPQDYASLFRKTYNAIKAVRPGAQVITQALAPFAGPFSAGSTCGFTHDANPLNWVQYMNQMLTEIKSTGGIDGIALHINSRGYSYDDIHSTQKVNAGGQNLYFSFYVYKDWVDHGIPADLYHLPLYATESNGIFYWSGGHPENPGSHYEPGWMQEVYAEINRYNQEATASGKPVYRAVNMYRWCAWCDGWNINNSPYKGQILSDLDQAIAAQYRWPDGATPPPPPPPEPLPDGDNVALSSVNWSASSSFNGDFDGSRAYDGVIAADSKWTSNGSGAESWLALDLGGEFDISGFIVRHAGAGGEPGYYNTEAFRLESGDSLSGPWMTLETVGNAAQEHTSTTVLASTIKSRYVRLYITDAGSDNYARIPEFEVYGTAAAPPPPPPPPETPPGDNVALGAASWDASSSFSSEYGGDKAYDGVISAGSKWTSDGAGPASWLALDLGGDFDVSGFIVRHAGAGGEQDFYNTEAYRLESGDSMTGPWTTLATVDNAAQENSTTTILDAAETTRFVRLYINDAGIDNYARIPEFEVYGTAASPPPPPPPAGKLIENGDFANGLLGWTVWNQRGNVNATVDDGALHLVSSDHNGGIYQQFDTGGAGATIDVSGFWESNPTQSNYQWAEVLVINGSRLPLNGEDVSEVDADVVLIYKNDTWVSPQGWSGTMDQTAPVANPGSFVASGDVATIILKSGNAGGSNSGTRYDDIVVEADGAAPPPPPPPEPVNLIANGEFADSLGGWTVWNQRGNVNARVSNGALHLASGDHNGGVYQRFDTGGAGTSIKVSGFWESNPTQSQSQWAEVLVINGSRLPANGEDVSAADGDVVLLYKNDTWASPSGWSGPMNETAAVANSGSFVASGEVATIILKSGNAGGSNTGTMYDDILVEAEGTAPPPPPTNGFPTAIAAANPLGGSAPLAVTFDGSASSDPDGDVLSYSWSFGNGSNASGSSVSHTYHAAGTYTATLTVDDGNGGSDNDTVTVTVTTATPPPGNGQQWVVLEKKSCDGPCDFNQIRADLNAQGKDIGFVKIGFHVAPNGNQNGLGDWERTLHAHGVPFFLKSVDSAGQIYEAVQLKAASGCIDNSRDGGTASCVPHQLVYRRSVTGQDYRPDVPYSGSPDCANPLPADTPYQQIYNETPYDAAVAHWQRHRDEFPPELLPYKHLIWVETINEINRGGTCDFDGDGVGGEPFPHNEGLIDPVFGQYTKEGEWIAEFAIHTANLAMAEGFNWAAFGWSSGEPEIGTWAGPKMREYLELIAANPDRVALATHEYSYTTDGLELAYPSLLGRFQEAFDVADHYGIGRPTIVITEFGWTLNDIPGVHQSMSVDLPWAAELYAPHHEIQGAAIWYLGGGWGGIDQEVQQLIAPMADYATRTYFVLGPAGSQ
jgi:PKD repeat protein